MPWHCAIRTVDHTHLPVAAELHAVQLRAYAQEAELLGATLFPPLERTVEELRGSCETFLAAFDAGRIVGAASVGADDEAIGTNISSLVVDPPFQRRGIGRALMMRILELHGTGELTVQTGARNHPALSLYRQLGFQEERRWLVGREPLELVRLRRAPDVSRAMQAYYAARAPEYDKVYAKPERQADLRAIERWLPSVFAGRSVIEVACGTGYWTGFVAPAARQLLGVDASRETLNIARARVAGGNARFIVGDAYRLPVGPAKFDAGFAGFWFSHVPLARVRDFLHGFHAALAPGAKVVLLDNRYVPGSNHAIAERDADGNSYQLRQLQDGSTHRVLKNFPTEADLRQSVAGMARDVRYHEWQYYWALEYVVHAR